VVSFVGCGGEDGRVWFGDGELNRGLGWKLIIISEEGG